MIIRLAQSLNSKINAGNLSTAPLDKNPYADWTARLFRANRTQYILLTHTTSLYSVVMLGKGVSHDSIFIKRALENLREFMTADCLGLIYMNFIVPTTGSVRFAKPLNRSVTGSMNEFELVAKDLLLSGEIAPFDVGNTLNQRPMSAIGAKESGGYGIPREVFKQLDHPAAPSSTDLATADQRAPETAPEFPIFPTADEQPDHDEALDELSDLVPRHYRDRFINLVTLTDAFCDEHLNAEYRELCRDMAAAVCQNGSPVLKGKAESWAAGIVYALGRVNCLTDPEQSPHMKSEQIAEAFGISVSTMQAKSRIINEALELMPFHPHWTLPSRLDDNPLVWMIELNGFIVDIRDAPRETQAAAYEAGLIPYIPADRDTVESDSTPSGLQLYELEVALLSGPITEAFAEDNPAVTRTIQIRSDQTLANLHAAIFNAFDRTDEHMYEFQIGGEGPMDPKARRYVLPMAMHDSLADQPPAGAVTTTVGALGLKTDDVFGYWFDFGDDWWHQVTVLAIHNEVPPGRYPAVTHETGASPPQYVNWDEED